MHNYSLEKLENWKSAIKLSTNIYSYTTAFPNEENYKNIRLDVESLTNKINALRNHFLKPNPIGLTAND